MGKTYMTILLLLFVVNYVSAVLEDQIFLIPSNGDLVIDTTAITDAIVGIGIDRDSIHRSDSEHLAIHVFGIQTDIIGPDSNGKITFQPVPGQGSQPDCGKSAGILSTMPNLFLGLLMVMICSGRCNTSMLILFVVVVFGYVTSTYVPPIKIIIYIPENHTGLFSLTVNSNIVPMVSPEVLAGSTPTVHCQVKGAATSCGVQSCDSTDASCLLPDAEFVGVLLPLSGPNAILGPVIKDSINYYLNVDGFSLPYLQFIFCDTQANADTALEFVNTLYNTHNVTIYVGPLSSDESLAIMNVYDKRVVLVSPAATASILRNPNTFISLSMGNEEYVLAQNMVIENDFSNLLQNIILIYRNDSYGQDISQIVPDYFEANINYFPYQPDGSDIASVVAEAVKVSDTNYTAVVIISYGEVSQILSNAQGTGLTNHPWYAIGLSYNPSLTDPTVIDITRSVQFKTLEYRGSNIEAHTADRTLFYQIFCEKYNKPLPASVALGFDAALLIANTPLIFQTTPYQAYFLLVEQGDVTFGFSGWLTLDDTGFRANGDFISQLVSNKDENPLQDDWLELGYVELDRHKLEGFVYFEITYRVISNYLVPGNWSAELECATTTGLAIYARNIRREFLKYLLDANSMYDISIPLYDTFLVEYTCDTAIITQLCPSALFGSDTQCEVYYSDLVDTNTKRGIHQGGTSTSRQVCNNASSSKGCVDAQGAPSTCERSNSTCASAGFKDACTKKPPFCPKK